MVLSGLRQNLDHDLADALRTPFMRRGDAAGFVRVFGRHYRQVARPEDDLAFRRARSGGVQSAVSLFIEIALGRKLIKRRVPHRLDAIDHELHVVVTPMRFIKALAGRCRFVFLHVGEHLVAVDVDASDGKRTEVVALKERIGFAEALGEVIVGLRVFQRGYQHDGPFFLRSFDAFLYCSAGEAAILRSMDTSKSSQSQMKGAACAAGSVSLPKAAPDFAINIPDVALIIEGGGMRASYTAGAMVTLLQRNLNFANVYGISAGSSHSVNYVSRDIPRTKASFVDLVDDANFGGLRTMIEGKGYFNAAHLYEGLAEQLLGTDDVMAFDWETFIANPADLHIEAIDWDSGETVSWTKKDMPDVRAMGLRVRASSTMPLFMPPTRVDGRVYMDGGMGSSWGICLEAARRDGYEKFFIVRTRPRGYRKKPLGAGAKALMKAAFRKHPVIAERTIERWQPYNELCDEIEQLEKSGAAYVFYPETMEVSNKETDRAKLEASFLRGLAQAQREADAWEEFLR